MELLDKEKPFFVSSIEDSDENDIITISVSTKEHGGCVEVYGKAGIVLTRTIKILDALNEGFD